MTRKSLWIAALSTVVEWYDFTLFIYLATVLSRVFYGNDSQSMSKVLASFAFAYLMRPLGAVIFGHVGDRYGRRRMMVLSMALMTGAMLAMACLPTRAQMGPAAGWAMLLLRCLMSFSVGGEHNGVVAYLLEGAERQRRGLVTSMASSASELGGLLAAGVAALTTTFLPETDLDAWGWRIPFFFGTALAASLLFARSKMDESPEFKQQVARRAVPKSPLRHVLTHARGAVLNGFAISALGSITYYVGITFVPIFLSSYGRMPESQALWVSTAAAVMAIVVTPIVGSASDRYGRKPVLLACAVGALLAPGLLFTMMASGVSTSAWLGALGLATLGGSVSAVGAVATAEQFSGSGRLSGLALGSSAATALFGGLAPYASQTFLQLSGWSYAPGLLISGVALLVFPLLGLMKETRPASTNL